MLLVEIRRKTLSRVYPDGRTEVVAEVGGGPNSSAVGPDGAVYITNNGGQKYTDITRADGSTFCLPGGAPDDYGHEAGSGTGAIMRVDLASGSVSTLYTSGTGVDGSEVALCGPNDLVFDSDGGFWFTGTAPSPLLLLLLLLLLCLGWASLLRRADLGKKNDETRKEDITGVWYARIDGSSCQEVHHHARRRRSSEAARC